jgi:mannose-6-phosphate isomerase-like protein (cupin superfamily)
MNEKVDSMQAEIRYAREAQEYETPERCHITEIANDSGDPQVSIARARVEPGVTTAWHALEGSAERYIIVSGQGRVEVDGLAPAEVGAGDVVRIPPGVRQRIANIGADDLLFYAVCSPRYRDDLYRALE